MGSWYYAELFGWELDTEGKRAAAVELANAVQAVIRLARAMGG